MKKILLQSDNLAVLAIVVLAFFPWLGVLNQSGFDITLAVLKNITTVVSVNEYAITATVLFAVLTLIMAALKKAYALFSRITFAAAIVAFVYGMIVTKGDYFSSMQVAYIIVVLLSAVMLLRQFGVIKK
jgi:hypothetical protein